MDQTSSIEHRVNPATLGANIGVDERRQRVRTYSPMYYGVNMSIEGDLRRFNSVGDRWAGLDESTYTKVKDYFTYHAQTVRAHHHGQVEHFGPKIYKLFPEFEEVVTRVMIGAHKLLETKLQEIEKAFAANDRAALPGLFNEYSQIFLRHLAEEEEGLLVVIERLTDQEYRKILREYMTEMRKDESRMHTEWAMAGMDEEIRRVYFKKLPFIVTVLWTLVWRRKFANKIRVFEQFV